MLNMSTKTKELSRGNGVLSLAEQAVDIHKTGYLRKLKTMKKKFFVMRRESEAGPARLEYYDSEKKWKAGALPKRTVTLRSCFNINRRADAKHRHVLALYTRDDSFALVADSEADLEAWLTEMLRLQHGSQDPDGDARPKPLFEHVWQVNVKTKGLGSSRNITGPHRLCLTAKALTLVKMHMDEENSEALEFPLMSIRRCGHSDCFFFMELGRSSVTGSGELWMQTEDTVIAQNMHETILGAMKTSRNKEELGPFSRPRSSSTSENSKPITHKRPAHASMPGPPPSLASGRDRCDSMPTSRSHNNSESHMETNFRVGSFDSASSILSLDESDGPTDYFNRYSHSLPMDIMAGPKEPTITEEVAVDEYLMMASPVGGNASLSRPTTLCNHLDASHQVKSSESNDYLKMSMSPTSSIPEANADGYIPMSPVGSLSSSLERGGASADLGYLPMEPQSSSGASRPAPTMGSSPTMIQIGFGHSGGPMVFSSPPGEYMDMAPLSTSLPKSVGESCTEFSGSWCSAHSLQDVPSSSSPLSTSLEGFHLDKVKSYFSPSEDDSEAYIKPVRAYSIGSRQQAKKSHFSTHLDQSRVRAYSVGSQVAPAALRRRRQRDPELELGFLRRMDAHTSKKSSSVPALPDNVVQPQSAGKRASNRNEDLMEINYDKCSSSEGGPAPTNTLPPTSGRKAEERGSDVVAPIRKLSSASSPGTVKAARVDSDYMTMSGIEGGGTSNYLSFSLPRRDSEAAPAPPNGGHRKLAVDTQDSLKESSGRKSYTGVAGVGSTDLAVDTHAMKEESLTIASTHRPNGSGATACYNDYIPVEVTGRGVVITASTTYSKPSNGAIPKSKSGVTKDLRPVSPEGQQLGEYVNLDLSKTWKWTQQAVKMPVVVTTTVDVMPSNTNGSASWANCPVWQPDASAPFTRGLSVGDGAAPIPQVDMAQPLPEANYENISLKSGPAVAVEGERVLNYASLDLAPPSGEEGSANAAQRSQRVDSVAEEGPSFSYAEIDFTKSEGLRNVSGTLREGRL